MVNNATMFTSLNDVVNFTTTVNTTNTSDSDLSFCWFQQNQTGSFVNVSFQSCSAPFSFDQNFSITAPNLTTVCGFFGANTTKNVHNQKYLLC